MSTNEHKEGYKKTKLGWIPEEWSVVPFGDVFQLLPTYSFSRNDLADFDEQGSFYYIHYGDIHSLYDMPIINLLNSNSQKVPKLKKSISIKQPNFLKTGDLVIADASEDYDGVGKCIEIGNVNPKSSIAGLHTIVARDQKDNTKEGFRTYILKNPIIAKNLKRIATGTSVYGISKTELSKFDIILPNNPEQQKIAEILSTWDTAIQKLDSLIKAKEKQKKALMQQLLSGKKRFAEFEGEEWEEVKLGSVVSRIERKVEKPDDEYLSIGIRSHGLGTFQKPDKDPDDNKMTHLYKVEEDDLIVNITFAWEGAISIVKKEDSGGYVSHRFPTYVFNRKKLLPKYFKYVIIQPRIFYLLGVISPGGAGRNRVLNKKDFVNLKIDLPSIEEQQKIGTILTKADKEIEELEQLLKKYEQQKKGLMQQLLTGQTRVTHLLSDQPKKAAS